MNQTVKGRVPTENLSQCRKVAKSSVELKTIEAGTKTRMFSQRRANSARTKILAEAR